MRPAGCDPGGNCTLCSVALLLAHVRRTPMPFWAAWAEWILQGDWVQPPLKHCFHQGKCDLRLSRLGMQERTWNLKASLMPLKQVLTIVVGLTICNCFQNISKLCHKIRLSQVLNSFNWTSTSGNGRSCVPFHVQWFCIIFIHRS